MNTYIAYKFEKKTQKPKGALGFNVACSNFQSDHSIQLSYHILDRPIRSYVLMLASLTDNHPT